MVDQMMGKCKRLVDRAARQPLCQQLWLDPTIGETQDKEGLRDIGAGALRLAPSLAIDFLKVAIIFKTAS